MAPMHWFEVLAVAALSVVPLALGFMARRGYAFRVVLLVGLALALYFWIDGALIDSSSDLTRAGQLLFPAVTVLCGLGLWCFFAYAGRFARGAFDGAVKADPTAGS